MIVYKGYNQQQLDNQYNNRLHVADYATYIERWKTLSIETTAKYAVVKDIAYGSHPAECLDIFPSGKANSKTLVFIHGGYWQMFCKEDFHFVANGFQPFGINTVIINYPLAPAATLGQMVSSCRKAVVWLHQNISAWGGHPEALYIAGHSAGGHLAAMLFETGWVNNNTATYLKGFCSLSGIFNLLPIQLSYINSGLKLSEDDVLQYSPVLMVPANTCRALLFAGQDETDEFTSQSVGLCNTWQNLNIDISYNQLPGIHHFSIAETLVDPASPVHKQLLQMMGI